LDNQASKPGLKDEDGNLSSIDKSPRRPCLPLDAPLRTDEIDSLPSILSATLHNLGESRAAYQAAIRICERHGVSAAVKVLNNIAENRPDNAEIVLAGCKNPYRVAIHKTGCQPGKIALVSQEGRCDR
jgi:hypothetical protein